MARQTSPPVLNDSWQEFIQSGVSIVLSVRGRDKTSEIVRGIGCRVSADKRKITLLVSSFQAAPLLEAIRTAGDIAVVFCRPSTHVTIQVKGSDARPAPVRAGDEKLLERYIIGFASDLAALGYSEAFVRALVGCDRSEVAAVTFTAEKAFLQTPGPGAGDVLRKDA